MGFEDWENKYRGQGKPHLSDFLDDEEDNVILRMGRPYPQTPNTSVCSNTHHRGFLPATYPEGYETIDRRRKKKIRDPGGMSSTEADKMRDHALLHEKRDQAAKTQEEDEPETSCLRPYKNGLLYKARMWAKNDLDHTLENYVAYKKEQDARMRAWFDFDLESSENLHYSVEPEEDIDIDDIAFLAEDSCQENGKHCKDRYSFSCESHKENALGIRTKKCGKAKIGGWAPEAMLSPVEEPSDEYVDPMDELQCLVETVSEYLAEKEEEISKYGSLPKSSKSRLSSLGSNRTDSFGEDKNSSSKDPRVETTPSTSSTQGISGVKNVMSSLFSSLADRVGGGPKQPVLSPQAPSEQPPQPGLTKLFSFIPKSNSSAPIAIVSPVESSPEKSFSLLASQQPHDARTQVYNQETKACILSHSQTSTKDHEFGNRPQCALENPVLGKFNPLKLFSAGDNGKLAEYKKSPESTTEDGRKVEKLSSSQERHMGQNGKQNSVIYNENLPVSDTARTNHQTQSASTFFSPLKKSLSLLMTPAVPIPPQGAPHVTVYPVFRSTEDLQREKPVESPPLTSKPKLPFLSSENLSTQQNLKAHGGVASSANVSTAMNVHPVQSYQESASTTSTAFIQKSVVLQENTEKRSLSSTFNPSFAPTGSNQNFTSNQQSQKGKMSSLSQHISNQKLIAAPHGMQQQTVTQSESRSFLTGLFKGSSHEDISHMDSSQPKQGGLLSGLLKFGSTSDLSGCLPQQTAHNNQSPKISNTPQFLQQTPSQQNASAPQMGGVLSGLLKFSSAENIPQNVHHPEPEMKKNIPGNYSGQQQPLYEAQQRHPQQKGLLSGLLKFASSENMSTSQTVQHQQNNQHYQEGVSQQNTQGPNQNPDFSNRSSSHDVVHRDTSKQGFTRQQTVPLQQPRSQRAGALSGLFKFSSADNISTEQHQSAQQHGITSSKSSHDQTQTDQPHNSSTQRTQLSGLLSGLFKSSSENVAQQQSEIIHKTHQLNKVPHSQCAQKQVLSGLLNKFTKSSEDTDTIFQTSTTQSLHQEDNSYSVSMKTPLKTQPCTYVTQLSSQEYAEKENRVPQTVQQKFLSGLFSKNVTENCGTHKQIETPDQLMEQQTPSTKFNELHSGIIKNATSDLGMNKCEVGGYLNQQQSRHALFSTPVSIDTESLDLRTSATFARSLQSQATYSSISSGNLSELYYPGSSQPIHPMACSTGNINSSFESHAPSPVIAMHSHIGGSTPSLYEATKQSIYQGQWSPYGVSPSYDENQWIRESALWQQFQNESLNHQLEDQGYSCTCEFPSLQASTLCCNSSNINQPFNSPTWQGSVCHQEQTGANQFEEHRNDNPYSKRKLWSSYEELANAEYSPNEDGALNLTTKQMNTKFGKWHSFNDGSTYSLNGVSYHECYYEETAPNLSYSANWQYGMDNEVLQSSTNGMIHQSHFNLNKPIDSKCPPNANADAEDSLYLEDIEWYQQWLSLLEQGMWWAADDGDCGYFVYTDHEYIYALLTDAAGEYVYACVPDGESWGDAHNLDKFPSAWLHNEMVLVCGFKIPLYNEDELLWLPGQDHSDSQLLNAPLDLSAAYRKGNQIMNLNLEQFSQMFENSFTSQGQQCLDFTSYRLNKVRMDPRQHCYVYEDQCKGAIDLSCHNKDHIGPYWNNHETKTFLAQKVAISLNSSPIANSNQHMPYSCYQPSQQRRPSTGVTVKHVDDVSEEEWRKRVFARQPNHQVKTISSLISSFVGKSSQVELNKTSTSFYDEVPDKNPKNILSSGFQTLKSKIIKEESNVAVSQPESFKEMQRSPTAQGRILPTVPTTVQVTPSAQVHTTLQKPRLSRQTTMVQQAAPPTQPNVTMPLGSRESPIKPIQSSELATDKPVDKQSEESQAGFMNFLKSAVGIEETKPDHQKHNQTSPNQQSKPGSTASLPSNTATSREAKGVSNIFGSISNLFSTEPSAPQKQQMKPSVTEGSLMSTPRSKGIQRQQTMDQSSTFHSTKSQPPNKSVSQVLSVSSSTGPAASQSETLPPTEQTKQDAGSKPSGGLFGFSIGEMLTAGAQSGSTPQTPPQEESLGKSILSMFSGPNPPQTTPKTEPLSQVNPPQPPQQESLGKSLLSMFGGLSPPQPSSQSKPTSVAQKPGTVPPKEPTSTGFLSMFSGPTSQQSQAQTGSLLGGILSGSASSTESPVKGLLSMFSDPTPPQSQPSTTSSQQRVAQSQTQHGEPQTQSKPQTQGQPVTSVFAGILGGLPASNESPGKALFSMFSGHSTQTPGAGGSTNVSSMPVTAAAKEHEKNIPSVINNVISPPQQIPNLSSAVVTSTQETIAHNLQQGTSQMSSVCSSHATETATTGESTEILRNKANSNFGGVLSSLPIDTTLDTTNTPTKSATIDGTDIASVEPNTEVVRKEISAEGAAQDPASCNKPPTSGLLSMISGSGTQTASSQVGFISDVSGKRLLSLFSGPSTEPSASQTAHPPKESASGTSDSKDPPTKGLFSVFAGSASQPSSPASQPGSSLLGAMFGGSSPQIPASQTGGSLLGGIFRGSAPQTSPQSSPTRNGGSAPPTTESQAGASLFGGLFGSAPQAAGSQSGGSILGGIFGGPAASNTASQTSGSFSGIFGGAATQTSTSQNSSSILGGIFGVSSSQTCSVRSDDSILGNSSPGTSGPNETLGKSLHSSSFGGLTPPLPATANTIPTSDHEHLDNSMLTTALTHHCPDIPILTKPTDDSRPTSPLAHLETPEIVTIIESKAQDIEEVKCQDNEKVTALVKGIQSKESPVHEPVQQPVRTEFVCGQSSQDIITHKVNEETPVTQSSSPMVQGLQMPSEPERCVGDSSADAVTGFMSSLFKPAAVHSESHQQQKKSLFGLGGTAPQAATGQTAESLLGGIFGGSNTQAAAPHSGASLLGGLFKGSTPQSGPQTTTTTTGGSVLSGMFGGGHSGGSLLGGMFGGVTAQTAGSQTGASVLGGIGGSLFGTMGQASKPCQPMPTEPKPTTSPIPQPQIKNESVPSKVAPSGTETGINKIVDSVLPNNNQIKSDSLTSSNLIGACPETFSSGSISSSCDPTHHLDGIAIQKPAVEEVITHEKPMPIKEVPEIKESMEVIPPDNRQTDPELAPQVNPLPNNAQPPHAKSLFGFISTQNDAGKTLGSLFSPTIASSLPSVPKTEVSSGLFSGIKTLSESLFKEEKLVAGKPEPSTTSLFGTKIGFPWQAEPPKPEAAPVVTSQPKTNNMSTGDETHTVQKVATAGAHKHESVGSTDDIANPQICISTPEVDPSTSLIPKEMERLVETYPSAGPTSGVQLDNQSKKDLLIAKRLVKA